MSDTPRDPFNPWSTTSVVDTSSAGATTPVDTQPHWSSTPPSLEHALKPKRSRRYAAIATVSALLGGVVGGVIGANINDGGVTGSGSSSPLVTAPKVNPGDIGTTAIAKAVEAIAPSVVTISVSTGNGNGAVGTGVILTEDGEILTNAHVVEGATTARVRLYSSTEAVDAEVLAADTGNDLALIKLTKASGLTPVTFADPDSIAVGDTAVAVGYALDLDGGPSVTAGIISAIDRTLTDSNGALDGLLQTDAAISSGNSGGPLINLNGQLVGINTAVMQSDSTTAANNVGFAIGIREVKRVTEILRSEVKGTKLSQGYLGISVSARTDGSQGAVIESVEDGSAADKAGLKEGDIVLAVDNKTITGQGALVAAIRDSSPGTVISIKVSRDGKTLVVKATLGTRPAN